MLRDRDSDSDRNREKRMREMMRNEKWRRAECKVCLIFACHLVTYSSNWFGGGPVS